MTPGKDPDSDAHGLRVLGISEQASSPYSMILLLLVSFSTLFLLPPQAAGQQAGLSSGQWALYDISGDLSGGVENSTLTVASFAYNVLTVQLVDRYPDEPVYETLNLNLATGEGNIHPGLYFAIYPDKKVGEPVYQNLAIHVQVEDRVQRVYAGASRQVNHARDSNLTDTIDYYWDVETGIFTEIYRTYWNSTLGQIRLGVHAIMKATNIWQPDPNDKDNTNDASLLYTGAITATSTLLLAAFLVSRYGRRKSNKK